MKSRLGHVLKIIEPIRSKGLCKSDSHDNRCFHSLVTNPYIFLSILGLLVCLAGCDGPVSSDRHTARDIREGWRTAYLASWHYGSAVTDDSIHTIPVTEIEWQAFTHLNVAGLTVGEGGTLVPVRPSQDVDEIRNQLDEIVAEAHKQGVPVLLSVGGWQSRQNFIEGVANGSHHKLISNLTSLVESHGLDGIDLNIEPLERGDDEPYVLFVNELYAALQNLDTPLLNRPLLTAATAWQSDIFARLHQKLDQINLMTYNYSNAWEGWVTWHNAPVYHGSNTFPDQNTALPSTDGDVKRFLDAGVPREKIGIGIDFYGYIWKGVHTPLQDWADTSAPDVQGNVPYHFIMDSLYHPDHYIWDDKAKAAYLSIDKPGTSNDMFVSFEDEKAVYAKINYAEQEGLGGVFVWELSAGYREGLSSGQRNPLQKALKEAIQN